MFCGWGHRRGCVCQVCKELGAKSPRFRQPGQPIINLSPLYKEEEKVIRKPKPGERTGPVEPIFNDADFKASYPSITDHLTAVRYEDGSNRATSTLLIFCDTGVLRVCLNDRDNNRSVFFTGETMEAALLSAENALATNTVEWRSRSGYAKGTPTTPF